MDLGGYIKQLRKSKKISQKTFSEKFHISTQGYNYWELGRREWKLSVLQELTKILNFKILIEDGVVKMYDNSEEVNSNVFEVSVRDFNLKSVDVIENYGDYSLIKLYAPQPSLEDKNAIIVGKDEYKYESDDCKTSIRLEKDGDKDIITSWRALYGYSYDDLITYEWTVPDEYLEKYNMDYQIIYDNKRDVLNKFGDVDIREVYTIIDNKTGIIPDKINDFYISEIYAMDSYYKNYAPIIGYTNKNQPILKEIDSEVYLVKTKCTTYHDEKSGRDYLKEDENSKYECFSIVDINGNMVKGALKPYPDLTIMLNYKDYKREMIVKKIVLNENLPIEEYNEYGEEFVEKVKKWKREEFEDYDEPNFSNNNYLLDVTTAMIMSV